MFVVCNFFIDVLFKIEFLFSNIKERSLLFCICFSLFRVYHFRFLGVERHSLSMSKEITIYTHAGCVDGLFAAYVIYHALTNKYSEDERDKSLSNPEKGNILFKINVIPIQNDKPYEIISTGDIIFVDIGPTMEVFEKFVERKQIVKILDHHVSNLKNFTAMAKLSPTNSFSYSPNQCGSLIAFEYYKEMLSNSHRLMELIKYVDDRDRWTWSQLDSHEICDAIFFNTKVLNTNDTQEEITKKFDLIDLLLTIPHDKLKYQGDMLQQQSSMYINQIMANATLHWMRVSDKFYKVAMCETRLLRSEVGNKLFTKFDKESIDFSCCWSYQLDTGEYWLSMRSMDNRADVSKICQTFGGGGHRNAAGCNIKDLPKLLINGNLPAP